MDTQTSASPSQRRVLGRAAFDSAYDTLVLKNKFAEEGDYYVHDRERYFETLRVFCRLPLPRPARILEVGGGQLAVLTQELFGDRGIVGDISEEFRAPVDAAGLGFAVCNLLDIGPPPAEPFDVVILLEVIEHLPVPPYTIFERLKHWIVPDGYLFLTTPNLFRLRNLARMALGREFTDRFMLPGPGEGLGHQMEYSAGHMRWQIERAGLEVEHMELQQLGQTGHSFKARMARRMTAPLRLNPNWRDELVAIARVPTTAGSV